MVSQSYQTIDGSLRVVRESACAEYGRTCEVTSVAWPGWLGRQDLPWAGIFWPLLNDSRIVRSYEGSSLALSNQEAPGFRYLYHDREAVPYAGQRLENGTWKQASQRTLFQVGDPIDPASTWPANPARPAQGARQNDLFPGAEVDLLGHGFTTLQALDALRQNDATAANQLSSGGCVVATLFGEGSGGFSGDPTNVGGQELAAVSFTIQQTQTMTKYTVHWTRNALGLEGFSRQVDQNEPDDWYPRSGKAPTCEAVAQAPWPAVSMQEFVQLMTSLGAPDLTSMSVTYLPDYLLDSPALKYATGFVESGPTAAFDAEAGRLSDLRLHGSADVDAKQNG
jgi:hypothetical protein